MITKSNHNLKCLQASLIPPNWKSKSKLRSNRKLKRWRSSKRSWSWGVGKSGVLRSTCGISFGTRVSLTLRIVTKWNLTESAQPGGTLRKPWASILRPYHTSSTLTRAYAWQIPMPSQCIWLRRTIRHFWGRVGKRRLMLICVRPSWRTEEKRWPISCIRSIWSRGKRSPKKWSAKWSTCFRYLGNGNSWWERILLTWISAYSSAVKW